jgi:hypothetical protein
MPTKARRLRSGVEEQARVSWLLQPLRICLPYLLAIARHLILHPDRERPQRWGLAIRLPPVRKSSMNRRVIQ